MEAVVDHYQQDWFEFKDSKHRRFAKSVWIPLRASKSLRTEGESGRNGYVDDYYAVGSVAFPVDQERLARKLEWHDIGLSGVHSGYVDDNLYSPAERYTRYASDSEGLNLVLDQDSHCKLPEIWHLNQDIILTLHLIREGNLWLRPEDNYAEVARIEYALNGKPTLLEMKAEYLRDYLCARGMGLYLTCFFKRDQIVDSLVEFDWVDGESNWTKSDESWNGRIASIHAGGMPFGEKVAVIHIARTDLDKEDDVPDLDSMPSEANTRSESWEKEFSGVRLYYISGELKRNEWIPPGDTSPRVRGDKIESTVSFTIDPNGRRIQAGELRKASRWLWFNPEVINSMLQQRDSSLEFCTRHTGRIASSYGLSVHFGVNDRSLITVYAKDLAFLEEWELRLWAAQNIPPDGKVSHELLMSQVDAEPAKSEAPEMFIFDSREAVNHFSSLALGFKLCADHDYLKILGKCIHRFRVTSDAGLLALAKDLTRFTIETFDTQLLRQYLANRANGKWGSLKLLDSVFSARYNPDIVKKNLAPLHGIYNLRHADSHLPSENFDDAFALLSIDRRQSLISQGLQMIDSVVTCMFAVAKGLRGLNEVSSS